MPALSLPPGSASTGPGIDGPTWARCVLARLLRPSVANPGIVPQGLTPTVWAAPWQDPSQDQRPGFPRVSSMNDHLAVHAPLDLWEQAWHQAHAALPAGEVRDVRWGQDLLTAMRAVVHHPLGTLDRFDALHQRWQAFQRRAPSVAATVWTDQFWRYEVRSLDDRPPITDDQHERLRWVNHWLDASQVTRRDDPAGLDRAWSWVQTWLDTGALTRTHLVRQRYHHLSLDPDPRSDGSAHGNGLALAWRYASVVAMEAWTRWEREEYGPAVIATQWERAIACQHPHNQHRSVQDVHERPLDAAPGNRDDRRAAWLAWGKKRILEGDPSPLEIAIPVPMLDHHATTAPCMTLGAWATDGSPHPDAQPVDQDGWLWRAAHAWERAVLSATLADPPGGRRPRSRL